MFPEKPHSSSSGAARATPPVSEAFFHNPRTMSSSGLPGTNTLLNQVMRQRIMTDRLHLAMDEHRYAQMIAGERAARQAQLTSYKDGCNCNCPATGCDEEKHQGPICKCPGDKKGGMPPPFAPFNFDSSARKSRVGALRQARGAYPPFTQGPARTQQKWVGGAPAYLPPDGDYPGGSTGIQQDGYIAYETGWANDGPFHGELAPLQEAGIAKSPVAQTLRQASVLLLSPCTWVTRRTCQ